MTVPAIVVDNMHKLFPQAYSGWRAYLQPFTRPTVPALQGVSLHVAPQEAVALLGTNGAGKSTLLRILATLLLPTQGIAQIAGFDTVRQSAAVRRSLGYHAGGDMGFHARLTARENLRFFGQLNHLPRARVSQQINALTQQFDLANVLDRQVRTLSSGTIQRLSLMRALLHSPKVLLLDEPTRSLDALAAAEFRQFLKTQIILRTGTSLLFASHSLAEIEFLADRVVILNDGKVVAAESVIALKGRYQTDCLEQVFAKATGVNIGTTSGGTA